ncbi:hypothetical protein [Sphaerisporangium corydalis]
MIRIVRAVYAAAVSLLDSICRGRVTWTTAPVMARSSSAGVTAME